MNITNTVDPKVYYLINVFGTWDGHLEGVDPNYVIVNAQNGVTGPDSTNTNTTNLANSADIQINNTANANNAITINADTGHNNVGSNTLAGSLTTGSINLNTNVINILNSLSSKVGKFALSIINIFGNWHGNGNGNEQPNNPPSGGDTNGTGDDPNNSQNPTPVNTNNPSSSTPNTNNISTNSSGNPAGNISSPKSTSKSSSTRKYQSTIQTIANISPINNSASIISNIPQVLSAETENPISKDHSKRIETIILSTCAAIIIILSITEYLLRKARGI
jgi:hypothetical protein